MNYPLHTLRPTLVLVVLSALFTGCILTGVFLNGLSWNLLTGAPAIMQVNGETFPLFLGKIDFILLSLLAGVFLLHLINEFFTRKACVWLSMGVSLVLALTWGVWQGILAIPFGAEGDALNTYRLMLDHSEHPFAAMGAAVLVGFAVVAFIFQVFRRWTHGSFWFIRVFVTNLLTLPVVALAAAWGAQLFAWNEGLVLSSTITWGLQLLIGSLILLPVYGILKMITAGFVGRLHIGNIKEIFSKKPIFKPKEKNTFEARHELLQKRIA